MNAFVPVRIAWRALRRNKVRALLTTLGIIVGTAAVIAVMAVGQGASRMVQMQIASMGNNLVLIFPGSPSPGGVHGGAGGQQSLTLRDADAIARECPSIRAVSPILRSYRQLVFRNNNWRTLLQGVAPEYQDIRNWTVRSGGFFDEADVRNGARVCVIGETVASNLFEDVEAVGSMIRIDMVPFWVVGVLSRKGTAAWGQDQDDMVLLPWSTMQRVLQRSSFDSVSQILVSVATVEAMPAAMEDIRAVLRQQHRIRPDAEDDFTVMDMTEISNTITQVSRLMTVLLTVIASISLVVGGIGIMNIMLVSVTERTREIGLRMAVGARPRDIMQQFLVESCVLSAFGSVFGVGFGAAAAAVLSRVNQWPVVVSPESVLIAVGVAACIGIFFGFYPAWRASRLNPIECLRYE